MRGTLKVKIIVLKGMMMKWKMWSDKNNLIDTSLCILKENKYQKWMLISEFGSHRMDINLQIG